MKKSNSGEMSALVYSVVIVAVLLAFPQFLRALNGNKTLAGNDPYYHARLSEMVLDNEIYKKDGMVYGGREVILTPYHYIVAGIAYVSGIKTALRVVPFISGIISALLFYFLLKRFRYDCFRRVIAIIILASSPAFIYAFSSMQDSVAIMFTLLGAYFFFDDKKRYAVISLASFAVASLFSVFNSLVIILPILAYSLVKKRKQGIMIITAILLCLIYFIKPVPLFYQLTPTSANLIKESISDIGGLFGVGVFYFILAIMGFVTSWKNKKDYFPVYLMIILLTLSFYFSSGFVMVYMNFYLSVLATLAFMRIKEINWQMKMIRNLTFIIIACGFLFSTLSFSARIAEMPPNNKMALGLEWLKINSKGDDLIASHYLNGYFIEYSSERPVLIDSYFSSISDFDSKYLDLHSLFYSADLKDAERILDKYRIRYIVVTEDMREGFVWETPNEGILYLFRNNETFKNVYGSKEIDIWKYIKNK